MTEWTVDAVAERFAEAADTARRLPPVRVQGYYNLWPAIRRQLWETWGASDIEPRPFPPTPAAIERMLETMRWVLWLEVEERHLVWMRAGEIGWKKIARRFACDRTTAWRRWRGVLEKVAGRLNAETTQREVVACG